MSNVYHKVEYKKLKIKSSDNEELVSLIKVSPQMMAEGDFSGIILKQDGSGYILDSDNTPLKKDVTELKEFIEGYCSLSQENLLKQLKTKNGIKKMSEVKEKPLAKAIHTLKKAEDLGLLSEDQSKKLSNLENGMAIKGDLSELFPKVSEEVKTQRSEELANVADKVRSEEPTKKRNRKNRNGLR